MKTTWALLLCAAAATVPSHGQKQELGLTIGHLSTGDRKGTGGTAFSLDSGTNLQANYQYRVMRAGIAQIYVGIHFLANDQRTITSLDKTLTRDVATVYLTPDVAVKFGTGRFQPWVTLGGGAAFYEQSNLRIDGARNPATRNITHGVFMAGGGVDVPLWRFIALRGEVREFYSGNPSYNTVVKGGQNNVLVGGGFVIRWH